MVLSLPVAPNWMPVDEGLLPLPGLKWLVGPREVVAGELVGELIFAKVTSSRRET
jgi:hypothetical protein